MKSASDHPEVVEQYLYSDRSEVGKSHHPQLGSFTSMSGESFWSYSQESAREVAPDSGLTKIDELLDDVLHMKQL